MAENTAARSVSSGLTRVSGNLPGDQKNYYLGSDVDTSRASTTAASKFKVEHMSYPIDVDSDPMQGHYIIFNISSLLPAQLKAEKRAKDMKARKTQLEAERNLPPQLATVQAKKRIKNEIAKQLIIDFPNKVPTTGTLNRSFGLSTMPRTLLGTSIALYMPPSVSVSYGVNYAEAEIGSLAEVGTGVIKAFTQGGGNTLSKLSGALNAVTGSAAQEGMQGAILKTLDAVATGAEALAQLEMGKVVTPRMELMFRGVGRRSFSFTFSFLPKSVQEAEIVENIIYTFKENMHPEYANATTRKEMRIPNTFEISYMYKNAENAFLNKISTCFLNTMSVNYGGDRFTAYESTFRPLRGGKGPPPQKSEIKLDFTELETLSKAHIKEGY